MYHEAMRKGLQLGVWAYASLLAAYCAAGDTQKVEATFAQRGQRHGERGPS